MKARLTLSLGGTYPAPPNTRRGTIEKPIAAAPVCPMNLRPETKPPGSPRDPSRFLTVPPNRSSRETYDFVAAVLGCLGLPHFGLLRSGLFCHIDRSAPYASPAVPWDRRPVPPAL